MKIILRYCHQFIMNGTLRAPWTYYNCAELLISTLGTVFVFEG